MPDFSLFCDWYPEAQTQVHPVCAMFLLRACIQCVCVLHSVRSLHIIFTSVSSGVAESDAHFLHGLLEGIARIERESYDLLTKLGATPVSKVGLLRNLAKHTSATHVAEVDVMYFTHHCWTDEPQYKGSYDADVHLKTAK